jgi:hypothetical protein
LYYIITFFLQGWEKVSLLYRNRHICLAAQIKREYKSFSYITNDGLFLLASTLYLMTNVPIFRRSTQEYKHNLIGNFHCFWLLFCSLTLFFLLIQSSRSINCTVIRMVVGEVIIWWQINIKSTASSKAHAFSVPWFRNICLSCFLF